MEPENSGGKTASGKTESGKTESGKTESGKTESGKTESGKMESSLAALLRRSDSHTALTLVTGRDTRIRWSYAELQSQRLYCQLLLQSCDVEAGDRVVVITHNLPHFFALLLASLALDICLLPLHPDFARAEVLDIMQRHKPRLIIIDESLPLPTWLAHRAPLLFRLRAQDQHWLREVLDTPLQAKVPPGASAASACAKRPLLLFHGSGTGAQSEAMAYTRSMLDDFLRLQCRLFAAFPDQPRGFTGALSARVNVLPVTDWGGLSFCLQTLLEGRTLHLLQSSDPRDQLRLLRQASCQLLMLVPAMVAELLLPDAEPPDLPALRYCLTMDESISPEQLQQLSSRLGIGVYVAHGMTECLSGLAHAHELLPQTPVGSCGQLVFGEARLMTAEGIEHPERGELWVRNDTTVPCYLDQQLVQQKYLDGWYRSGDVFARDQQGFYFFQGRIDAMCVINGRNIFPREVEVVLLQHPMVAECVVCPVRIDDGKQRLAAMVVLLAGHSMDATTLLDFYLQYGAMFATPVCVEFCQWLPRNTGGKYDRDTCAGRLQAVYDQRRSPLRPASSPQAGATLGVA
jgi:acyl-coenzyme A synthetase/AMP-(fatty) acid ligase